MDYQLSLTSARISAFDLLMMFLSIEIVGKMSNGKNIEIKRKDRMLN